MTFRAGLPLGPARQGCFAADFLAGLGPAPPLEKGIARSAGPWLLTVAAAVLAAVVGLLVWPLGGRPLGERVRKRLTGLLIRWWRWRQ